MYGMTVVCRVSSLTARWYPSTFCLSGRTLEWVRKTGWGSLTVAEAESVFAVEHRRCLSVESATCEEGRSDVVSSR